MNRAALTVLATALVTAVAAVAAGQTQMRPAWGRITLFGDGASTTLDSGARNSFSELMSNVTFESATGDDAVYEYRADLRLAGYPNSTDRPRQVSIYDAYGGFRVTQSGLWVRAGQMWLNDLGGLGALGGAMLEYRQRRRPNGGRWRAAIFGGLEPQILNAGYVSNVTKFGAMGVYEGAGARRHVLGLVDIRDSGRTERAVLVFTNFLPVDRRLFVYQSAEYDVRGPAVSGAGSLTYFFVNGRYAPTDRIEFQGIYHRGRSLDSRSILRDQLDGRPIDPRTLDGLRFESFTGRVTVAILRNVRVFAGYGQDRNNRDSAVAGRITYGVFASNLLGTGIDLNASDSRIDRGTSGSYDSWYVSLGRSFTSKIYVSGDYGSSLSVFHFTSSNGFVIETRPQSKRIAMSGLVNLSRQVSLMLTGEHIDDGTSTSTRFLSGFTYRF